MRPILMIERLQNLHDARYCAAVGIAMASFNLNTTAENALTPKIVGEIVSWLSGLECIGEFGHASTLTVHDQAITANLDRILLPLDFALEEISSRSPRPAFMFDLSGLEVDQSVVHRMQALLVQFPDTLFLLKTTNAQELSAIQHDPSLTSRCIVKYDDADSIYQQMKTPKTLPFGFCLGAFVCGYAGELEYDSCDEFLSKFEEIVSA